MIDALELGGCRFALAKKVDGVFSPRVFEPGEWEAATAWLRDADDAWITGNPIKPRVSGRPKAADVAEARWLLLDSDPVDLSDEARADALALATEAYESLGCAGWLIDSGRGAQCWLRVESDVPRRALLRFIAASLGDRYPLAVVDATHDPGRLMRLPGYANSKTDRIAEWIVGPASAPAPEAISGAECAELLGDWSEPQATGADGAESFDPSPPSAMDRGWLVGGAKALWDTPPEGDRSTRDFAFLAELLRAGCPKDAACRLLWNLPHGKANEESRGADYWLSTLGSVHRADIDAAARTSRLAGLVAAVEEDRGAAFDAAVLADLVHLRANDTQGWVRMRGDLMDTRRFKMSDLERAMDAAVSEGPVLPPDDYARLVESAKLGEYWQLRAEDDRWHRASIKSVDKALTKHGGDWDAARAKPWRHDSVPFAPQWMEGRRFNASQAQFRVKPAPGDYATWEQLFNVVGRGLDEAVAKDAWCITNGIPDGGCYLFVWLACLFQHPRARTAWLFCFSLGQNIGKSMFHEAITRHLLSGGVTKADKALVNERGFNAELEGAVLVTVEETNLGRARSLVRERMKDLITGDTIALEGKGRDQRIVTNWVHGYQTANDPSFCPLAKGDTRITAWEALPPREDERIDKEAMHVLLSEQAPAFLDAVLSYAVPERGDGRLRVPVVGTAAKEWQQEASQDMLTVWRSLRPDWVSLSLEELVEAAQRWLALKGEDLRYWRRAKILRSMPTDGKSTKLRMLCDELREMDGFTGTPAELAEALGRDSAKSLGWLLAELERRHVHWIGRNRSAKRTVTINRSAWADTWSPASRNDGARA